MENWDCIPSNSSSSKQADILENILTQKLNNIFPNFTTDLKLLDRQKKREYRKNKESQKYLNLKEKYESLFDRTSKAYLSSLLNLLKSRNQVNSMQQSAGLGLPLVTVMTAHLI